MEDLSSLYHPLHASAFPAGGWGAWRTSHGGTCIAGEWNGDKAYGEERDEGEGIIAAGEGDFPRAAPLSLRQRLLLARGIRVRQSVQHLPQSIPRALKASRKLGKSLSQ